MIRVRTGWPSAVAMSLMLSATASAATTELPPYASALEDLAEIMGSLQFLTELCEDDAGPWRSEMEDLIILAEADEAWRLRLSDRYNLGYSSFAATYRTCTAAAFAAIDHYRFLGAERAADIAGAFGTTAVPAASTPSDG